MSQAGQCLLVVLLACSIFLTGVHCYVNVEVLNVVSLKNSFHCLSVYLLHLRSVWPEWCRTAEWSLSSAYPLLHGQKPGKQFDLEQISSLWVLRGTVYIGGF